MNTVILGSGIAGISAGYHLKKKGISSIIFEKDNDWGGLCGNFTINGFRFDRFVHFSFAPDEYTQNIFEKSSPLTAHLPISYNYWQGYWLKHPAQNNLAVLPVQEKVKIIEDFIERPQKEAAAIQRYDEWLRVQYGNYFAENFPFRYTRKYWGREPQELETKWVGNRLHISPLREVLKGAFAEQKENFYYTQTMKYPQKGGFRSILNDCRKGLDIRFNKQVMGIDVQKKLISFSDGTKQAYTSLISTLPMPEIIKMLPKVPTDVLAAASQLKWTCGYQVSLGFRRADVAKHLWFYIYDEDVPPARVYSPNLKSPDNVPQGCSSLQAEIFFACDVAAPSADTILKNTIDKLQTICQFSKEDIAVQDIRFEPYANIIFTPEIYDARQQVLRWLKNAGIVSIGRFGKWDYLWTHQLFEDGQKTAKQLIDGKC